LVELNQRNNDCNEEHSSECQLKSPVSAFEALNDVITQLTAISLEFSACIVRSTFERFSFLFDECLKLLVELWHSQNSHFSFLS
jgi:hypothetical protein